MRPVPSILVTAYLQVALLTAGACAATAAEPRVDWLQQPCALLGSQDLAHVLPAAEAALVAKPYIGRRESDCLWTDTAAEKTLRLVLHPSKDAARVADRLQRLQSQDVGSIAFAAGAADALLSADRSRLSIAVGNWMVSLIGSVPLDAEVAQRLATELAKRVSQAGHTP